METNLFYRTKQTLVASSIKEKFNLFEKLYKDFQEDRLSFSKTSSIEVFTNPSYYSFCKIVDPKEIPQKKNLVLDENKAYLLHAIAHIEYSAIDLALDACYRFQDMPKEFYKDWLEVADDEIRHFKMISELLVTYGVTYSDLAVHKGLFEASMKTLELIPRMALIPRYMEANGLDANALIISKLKKIKDTQKIIELLEIILEEEIDHVKKGDRWYKYGCALKKDFKCDYFKIVNSVHKNSFNTNKHINIEARKRAGFSDEEIARLTNKESINI